jgi:hypothetical protein
LSGLEAPVSPHDSASLAVAADENAYRLSLALARLVLSLERAPKPKKSAAGGKQA